VNDTTMDHNIFQLMKLILIVEVITTI